MTDVVFYIIDVIYKTVYHDHNYGEYFIVSLEKMPKHKPNALDLFTGIRYMPSGSLLIAYTPLILDIKVVSISISSKTKPLVPLHFSFHTIKVYIG
jgi:hypothetical protein